jgi:phenylacetate-CoA ligase
MSDARYRDWLQKGYYDYRAYVPARLLYHADFFRVGDLLGASEEAIAAEAGQRLKHVLGVALSSVPFYRRTVKLSAAELANEPPRQLLERFPYLVKAQVMECQRDFLDERLDPRRLNYASSEGSSGQGIGVWRTKRLADIEKAFYTHEWGKLGFSFDKARYLRMGADARRLAHQPCAEVSGNRLLLSPSHISAPHKRAIVAAMNAFRPQFVHAYPSAAAALAELIDSGDLDFQAQAVLLASEPATPQQLGLIAGLFRCPISISYGMTERTNLAFAACADGARGPFRFEPLYGVTENRWNNGRAEIVGTSCWNDVMPLIRYCTDDFGAVDEMGNCHAIDGRAHEYLVDRSGNRIPGLLLVIDGVTWDFVRMYQVRQRRPGAITFFVVARYGSLNPAEKKLLLDFQLKRWGSFFDIELDEVADIPLSASGKRQLVVNELREARQSHAACARYGP